MLIGISELINLNISLFVIALFGLFVIRKNLIVILIALELLALSVSLNYVFFSIYLDDIVGQLIALLILSTVGAESAIGLALAVTLYRIRADVSIDVISVLKG
jgi:NADH-quinone oxidoreductase subunit K